LLAEPKQDEIKLVPSNEDQLFYVQEGQEAMGKALSILENSEGWKVEIKEVTSTNEAPSSYLSDLPLK